MLIKEIVERDVSGELQDLAQCLIYTKDVVKLDTYLLLIHYTLIKNHYGRSRALRLFRALKGECLMLYMLGDIEACDVLNFRPPVMDIVAPDAFTFLNRLSLNERAAILVAVSEDRHLSEMVELTWTEVKLNHWSELSTRIFRSLVPRIGCDFVFWTENQIGNPLPCLNLVNEIAAEFDVSWSEFSGVLVKLVQHQHFAAREIDALISQ